MTNKKSKSQAQLPRGFVRLQDSLDYGNWVYTSKAQWASMGILYVLTETNPRLEVEVKTVPLTPDQVEMRTLQWRGTEQNRVSVHNTNIVVRRQTAGEELGEGEERAERHDQPDGEADAEPVQALLEGEAGAQLVDGLLALRGLHARGGPRPLEQRGRGVEQ